MVEQRFVKLTEASIDIGRVILRQIGYEIPETNPGTMRALANHGVIDAELADAMASAARFRNVLAHTYGPAIDHDVVYDALHDLDRYRRFLRSIRHHLDSIDEI